MLPPPSSRRFPRQSLQHRLPDEYRNMRFILFHHQREKTYLVAVKVGCTDLVRVCGGSTKGSTDMNSFVNLGHLRTKYFHPWITSFDSSYLYIGEVSDDVWKQVTLPVPYFVPVINNKKSET